MRAGDDPHCTVVLADGIEGNAYSTGGRWLDRPVLAILVPGHFAADSRWLTEEVC
jgi:hypothetical protein